MEEMTFEILKNAVSGNAAALRQRMRLQSAGGPGTKVFPPTHSGGVYAWEERRLSSGEIVTAVLLDSVQSQANRMEQALLEAHRSEKISLPLIQADFSQFPDIGMVTSLDAPHRIADAIFRDSLLNGTRFRESTIGTAFSAATIRNANVLFRYCPTALIFGVWDSTGSSGGAGNKFQRAVVSEIVGFKAQAGVYTSSRLDPLGIRAIDIYETGNGDWSNNENDAIRDSRGNSKKIKPSDVNHSNIPPTIAIDDRSTPLRGGVTIDYALKTTVLSLPALRRLHFPNDDGIQFVRDSAARTTLAALALAAITLNNDQGYDLRSRCQLIPEDGWAIELVDTKGAVTPYELSSAAAIDMLKSAVNDAEKLDLHWEKEAVTLTPEQRLIDLVTRSRQSGGEE